MSNFDYNKYVMSSFAQYINVQSRHIIHNNQQVYASIILKVNGYTFKGNNSFQFCLPSQWGAALKEKKIFVIQVTQQESTKVVPLSWNGENMNSHTPYVIEDFYSPLTILHVI